MNGEYEIKMSSGHIETNEDLVQDAQKKKRSFRLERKITNGGGVSLYHFSFPHI